MILCGICMKVLENEGMAISNKDVTRAVLACVVCGEIISPVSEKKPFDWKCECGEPLLMDDEKVLYCKKCDEKESPVNGRGANE